MGSEPRPSRLYSPQTICLRQSGQPHELATALCSILLGLGYDAYIVFGYANKDTTLRIMTRIDSPYSQEEKVEIEEEEKHEQPRYVIKPTRELKSKYLEMMEQREIDKIKAEEEKLAELERQRILAEEIPPPDELEGMRLHAWILLTPESRNIEEHIFVEPSTGLWYSLSNRRYVGIESVWNDKNYWVNLQDCSKGLETLKYNFDDTECWEHLLPGEPIETRKFFDFSVDIDEQEKEIKRIMEEKHLDMPPSWVERVEISHEALALLYPHGISENWYKRTFVEEFGAFVQRDGLLVRIHRYKDFNCSILDTVEEIYKHRVDKMLKTVTTLGEVKEFYGRGREDCASEHIYNILENGLDSKRQIYFYSDARHDGLTKIDFHPEYLVEEYTDRDDKLIFRQTKFAPKGCPPPGYIEGPKKIILKIVEKFARNLEIPANRDVAIREFNAIAKEITLQYHFGEGKVTASSRTFIKPELLEMDDEIKFDPDLTYGYEADIEAPPPSQLELYYFLKTLLKEEEKTINSIRAIEDLVVDFLKLRNLESTSPSLEAPLFSREQNLDMRLAMLEKERKENAHRKADVVEEINFLMPLLEKYRNPISLSQPKANKIRNECLTEFKNLLLARGQDMHQQFQSWSDFLTEKKKEYAQNMENLTEKEEVECLESMNNAKFLLQVLEIRMNRHKETSCQRYASLVSFLDRHPLFKKS